MNITLKASGKSKGLSLNVIFTFWVIVLFAYSSNNALGSAALLISIPFVFTYLFKGKYNALFFWSLITLLTFSVIYGLISYFYGLSTPLSFIRQVFYPFSLFMLGNLLVKRDKSYKKTYAYFYAVILGSALYGSLSIYNAINLQGIPIEHRTAVDIWNGAHIAATGINSYISLGLCLLPVIFLSAGKEKNFKWKVLSVIAFVASAYAAIQLANRTGIILVVASIIVVGLLSKKTKRHVRNSLRAIILIGFGYILFYADAFGMKTWWENSLVYNRFVTSSLGDDPRFEAWKLAFTGLWENPMGGRATDVGIYYAHNMWLDIGVDGGIVSFVLMGIFTLVSIVVFLQFLKLDHPTTLKVLVISMFTGFFVTFFFEPVMQGLMDYFTFYCFVLGALLRINTDKVNSDVGTNF